MAKAAHDDRDEDDVVDPEHDLHRRQRDQRDEGVARQENVEAHARMVPSAEHRRRSA
jgi:hypothetical protein